MSALPDDAEGDRSFSDDDALRPGAPRAGDVLASKYRVERVVGAGGMGVVVAARHLSLGQTVAVKLMAAGPAPSRDAVARFVREAQAAAALQSDHVVRIYDVGQLDDGSPFMVMEYLRGEDLAYLLDCHGAHSIAVAVEYVLQACDAIAEAHDRGIVHRDLKPSNLFITSRSDGTALVKVLDFGISKSLNADGRVSFGGNLTETRTVLGSPYYMSPEQVRDAKHVDARTDVWALGVILYELVTGRPPFDAETLPAVCAAIAADAPTPPSVFRPDVPEDLERVVLRCLMKDPARRFQSVRELAAELLPFAGRELRSRPSQVLGERKALTKTNPSAPTLSASSNDSTMLSEGTEPPTKPKPAAAHPAIGEAPAHTGQSAHEAAPAHPGIGRRWIASAALGGLALLGVAVAVVVTSMEDIAVETLPAGAEKEIASPPAPAVRQSFSLRLESTPPGASVLEQGRLLGTTPLELSVARDTVRSAVRTFVLAKEGFAPHTVVQGDSAEDVRIAAALVPAPAVQAPPASVSEPVTPPPARRPARRPATAPSNVQSPSEPDIRMQR